MLAERDLIKRGLPLVNTVANLIARQLGGSVPTDDLCGIGHVALLEIARSFDPKLSSFESYAFYKIKWAMLDGLRRERHWRTYGSRALALVALERFGEGMEPESDEPTTIEEDQKRLRRFLAGKAAAMAVSFIAAPRDPALRRPETETPEERFAREELVRVTRDAIRALPDERARDLLERHYFGGEPFDAIARDLGISKSWASRLHDRAITALAETMAGLA